jgi:uncharacterized SAM-binding protein YcdF (DUF218 family)
VPSTSVVAAICAAEILGLAGFSIVAALLPQFIEAWSLTNTQAGWLAVIPSTGGSRVPRASFGSGAVERVGTESWAARDKM